jgi:hypothetical protein
MKTAEDSARLAVLKAASDLEDKSREIGFRRGVDTTEACLWLREIAQQLRDASYPPEMVVRDKLLSHAEFAQLSTGPELDEDGR